MITIRYSFHVRAFHYSGLFILFLGLLDFYLRSDPQPIDAAYFIWLTLIILLLMTAPFAFRVKGTSP